MRMARLLARIIESGQRTGLTIRVGAEQMEAAEAHLTEDLPTCLRVRLNLVDGGAHGQVSTNTEQKTLLQ
jgi:hypothetical protein